MCILLNGKGIILTLAVGVVVYCSGFLNGVKDEQLRREKENEKDI